MIGVSGGSAELGDEADRYAFQGSMCFLDAAQRRVLRKTWTIHPPKQPDDDFAGAGIWSTPAIDREAQGRLRRAPPTRSSRRPSTSTRTRSSSSTSTARARRSARSSAPTRATSTSTSPASRSCPATTSRGNPPPYYPQGIGSCGDIDLDFGASPNLFTRPRRAASSSARARSRASTTSSTRRRWSRVWTQIVGPPTSARRHRRLDRLRRQVGLRPDHRPRLRLVARRRATGAYRWVGAGRRRRALGRRRSRSPTASSTRSTSPASSTPSTRAPALLLAKRPLLLGGGSSPASLSWGGVSVARNTVYAAVGDARGLSDGLRRRLHARRRQRHRRGRRRDDRRDRRRRRRRRWRRRRRRAAPTRPIVAGPGARVDRLRDPGRDHAGRRLGRLRQPRRRPARRVADEKGSGRHGRCSARR